MDTLNRVVLAILAALVAVAALIGILLVFGIITADALAAAIPYRQVADFFTANVVAASLIGILALAIILALSLLWLRAQYVESLRAVAGGEYAVRRMDSGDTLVNYGVVERAMDGIIEAIPGVMEAHTDVYRDLEERLLAHTSLMVRRGTNIHRVDESIRDIVTRSWLDKLGISLSRHDVTVNLEPVERRVS